MKVKLSAKLTLNIRLNNDRRTALTRRTPSLIHRETCADTHKHCAALEHAAAGNAP